MKGAMICARRSYLRNMSKNQFVYPVPKGSELIFPTPFFAGV